MECTWNLVAQANSEQITRPNLWHWSSACNWHCFWALCMIMQAHASGIQIHALRSFHHSLAFPSINRDPMPFKLHTWFNLNCCRNQKSTSHQRSNFIFFKFFRSKIQLHLVEFLDLKLLNLHHSSHWSSVLAKQAKNRAQVPRIQAYSSTSIFFEYHHPLTYLLGSCVFWSPHLRGKLVVA
jgi:hypothetical protein